MEPARFVAAKAAYVVVSLAFDEGRTSPARMKILPPPMGGLKESTMCPLVDTEKSLISRRVFWDPAIHREELDRIFRRCWLFVAHETEIVEPGDYVTQRMGVDPVIVIRDE